jgi:hypothetical protein
MSLLAACSSNTSNSGAEMDTQVALAIQRETGLVNANLLDGQGELLVKNGTEADGLVVLTTLDQEPVAAAYIREGDSYRLTGIPDGQYLLFFSQGQVWDEASGRFIKDATYQRFTDVFNFSSIGYRIWEVALYPVVGGNAASQSVDPEEFPNPP